MIRRAKENTKWLGEAANELKTRREVRRETILIAAARCFSRLGYHRTTIDDIARELGVTKAAVYYYTDSKEQIYLECNEAAVETGLEGLRRADALPGTSADKLRFALRWYIEHAIDPKTCNVVLYGRGTLPPKLHKQLVKKRDSYEQRLRHLVQQGIDEGVFIPCNIKLIVYSILGSISSVSKWFSPEGELSSTEVADIFSEHLVRGLLKAPSDPAGQGQATGSRPKSGARTTKQRSVADS